MDKILKAFLGTFKKKIIAGIIGFVAALILVVGLKVALSDDDTKDDKKSKTQTEQSDEATSSMREEANGDEKPVNEETEELPDAETVISQYEGNGDPYFYKENAWLMTHDYFTGQFDSQPSLILYPNSDNPLTLPIEPQDLFDAEMAGKEYTLSTVLPSYYHRTESELNRVQLYISSPEDLTVDVYNYSQGELTARECIDNRHYYINEWLDTEEITWLLGYDLSGVEELDWKDEEYMEATLELLIEDIGSPNYISYNYAGYITSEPVLWGFSTAFRLAWVFDDYVIWIAVKEDFKEDKNGNFVVDIEGGTEGINIYTREMWDILEADICPNGNQIEEIYSEDFLMPLGCEFPEVMGK